MTTSVYVVHAQLNYIKYNFTYKTEPYNPLTNGTYFLGSKAQDSILLGFNVNIGTSNVSSDTLFISRKGAMYLPQGSASKFNFFGNELLKDGAISYKISGTTGNYIAMIEFSNIKFGYDNTGADFANFQVWLYENGIIEVRFGSSSVKNPDRSYEYKKGGPSIGGPKTWLIGNVQSPIVDTPIIKYLTGTPPDGMVYRFAPDGVNVSKIGFKQDIQLFPNPGDGLIHFKTTTQGKQTVSVYNILQHKIAETLISNQDKTLDITPYPAGMYIISVADEQGQIQTFAYLKQQ